MDPADSTKNLTETTAVRKNLKASMVRGASFTALSSAADFVFRLISISILAHLIAPENFGLVSMVGSFAAIGAQIVHLGLGTATIQRADIDRGQLNNLFWINAGFGFVLTLVFCGLSPVLAAFYNESRLVPITMVMATMFLWTGLSVQHEALMTRQMKQGQLAIIRVTSLILSSGGAILLALNGASYWAIVYQEVSRMVYLTLGFWLACRWLPGRPAKGAKLRELLHFGGDMTVMQLLNAVVLNLDRILLGRFFGAELVGIYWRAQQLIMTPVEQLNQPIQSVAQPALALLQSEKERFRRYFRSIVFVIGLATMPVAALGFVYAEEATLLFLGPNWDHAAIIFRIFSFWAFIRPVLGMAGIALISLGQSKRLLHYSYLRNVVFITMTCIGLNWGIVGVAIAQTGSTYLLLLPCLFWSFAKTPVTVGLFFSTIKAPVVASVVMVLGLTGLRAAFPMETIPALITGCVAGAPLYLLALLIFPSDRKELLGIISNPGSALRSFRPQPSAPHAPAPAPSSGSIPPAQTPPVAQAPVAVDSLMASPGNRGQERHRGGSVRMKFSTPDGMLTGESQEAVLSNPWASKSLRRRDLALFTILIWILSALTAALVYSYIYNVQPARNPVPAASYAPVYPASPDPVVNPQLEIAQPEAPRHVFIFIDGQPQPQPLPESEYRVTGWKNGEPLLLEKK